MTSGLKVLIGLHTFIIKKEEKKMKHWVFTCFIEDALDNIIMKQSFLKKWQAEKWGIKQITKHKKIDEWYYDIIQESEED